MKRRRVAAYARVSTDSDEQFTSYEAQVYQSGIFDTVEYELSYEKSPINKDFRRFLASSEVLISVGRIRLSVYAMRRNRIRYTIVWVIV